MGECVYVCACIHEFVCVSLRAYVVVYVFLCACVCEFGCGCAWMSVYVCSFVCVCVPVCG